MTKILPQGEWVVFEEIKQEEAVKHGSIFVPTANTDQYPLKKGKVLILGPDTSEASTVAVGDVVLYHTKTGIPFLVDGEKFLLTKADNFYCVLKEEE